MRTLVIGSGGQLGSDICGVWPADELVPLMHQDLDICEREEVFAAIRRHRPQLVVNTAAYHRVDECESNALRAFQVNAVGAKHIADACQEVGAALIYLSTDYVFAGDKGRPYLESDPPDPINVYGVSKVAGELLVRYAVPRHFIVRSSGLFGVAGASGKGGNFVETMLRLAREGKELRVVDDQTFAPTYTRDLAAKLRELALTGCYGTYHITGGEHCSWWQFACKILELVGLQASVIPISSEERASAARRPRFSVLANEGLRRLGLAPLRPWHEALIHYLKEKGYI